MNKAYRHKPIAPDEYLGRVDQAGKTYETRLGPDLYVGRVDLNTGKIYESRLGPDKLIGRVDSHNGKVYHSRLGPDEYLGRVDPDGKCYLHKRLARDEYMGKVTEMLSLTHGAAAFLLLILPALEEDKQVKEEKAAEEALNANEDESGLDTVQP